VRVSVSRPLPLGSVNVDALVRLQKLVESSRGRWSSCLRKRNLESGIRSLIREWYGQSRRNLEFGICLSNREWKGQSRRNREFGTWVVSVRVSHDGIRNSECSPPRTGRSLYSWESVGIDSLECGTASQFLSESDFNVNNGDGNLQRQDTRPTREVLGTRSA